MKRIVSSKNKGNIIKGQDWFSFVSRIESQTGMKATHESMFHPYREYIELEDRNGNIYDIGVDTITYYVVDLDELNH